VLDMPVNMNQRPIVNVGMINDTPTNETVHYQKNPPLNARKTSNPLTGSTVKADDEIVYTITVTNPGPTEMTDVEIVDYVPAGTELKVPHEITNGGVYRSADDSIHWKIDVPGNDSVSVSFTVTVKKIPQAVHSLKIVNVGLVNGNPTNQTVHKVARPRIVAEKTAVPPHLSEVLEGQVIRYYITVRNIGEIPDRDIKVRDEIPEFTTLLADSVSHGGVLIGTIYRGVLDWTIPELLNGA